MFEIKISGQTAAELKANLVNAAGMIGEMVPAQMELGISDSKQSPAEESETETPRPKRGRKPGKTAAPKATEAALFGEEAEEETDVATGPAVTLEDVKVAMKDLMAKGQAGMQKAVEILREHGASKLSELKEDQYGSTISKIKTAFAS